MVISVYVASDSPEQQRTHILRRTATSLSVLHGTYQTVVTFTCLPLATVLMEALVTFSPTEEK